MPSCPISGWFHSRGNEIFLHQLGSNTNKMCKVDQQCVDRVIAKFDSSQTNDYVMISLLPIIIKCPIFLFLTSLLQTAIRFHQRRSSIGNKRRPRSFATKTFTGKWTAALKWSGTSADCSQMKQDNSKVTTKRKKQSFQHLGDFKNKGTPKWMVYNGKPY